MWRQQDRRDRRSRAGDLDFPSPLVGELPFSPCGRRWRGRSPRRMRGLYPRRQPLTRLRCFASQPPSPTRGEGKKAPHIGGMIPSRPTLTRLASSVPSAFWTAPKMMILAPGFSSDLSPTTKVTIGLFRRTTTFFSPPFYLTSILSPP